jgi:4-hydroxybutyrate CoA-transferase
VRPTSTGSSSKDAARPPSEAGQARYRAALVAQAAHPTNQAITAHIAGLVRDGDAVQVGTGSTTSSLVLGGALDGKSDLEFYGVDYMHDPAAIAKNDNLVAINNALCVDLTGQIAAGHFGSRIWSGTGGQFAYALGAFMSRGGRSITVLPATAQDGTVSRIVAEMPAGQIITVPRDIADTVVTEFGVAELLNKTQRERARALIEIAHPDFQSELKSEARRLFGA